MTGREADGRTGTLLCLGLGYTARSLARRLSAAGWRIAGTARSNTGAAAITAEGWQGHVLREDGAAAVRSPMLAAALSEATHILVSVPPDGAGDPVLRALGPEIEQARQVAWIGYLSTVGVYGDHGGAWIDESTPPRDPGLRGERRLASESAWLELGARLGKRVAVFRLPGIYGPGRSAVDQLRAGTARRIVKPGQVFNRMHVDDIALALAAAMTTPTPHRIFNLCDDEPAPSEDVVAYAAALLGLAPPPAIPFAEAQLSPMAASFYAQSKRVSNRRMKHELGVRLVYPTYREGLAAIAELEGPPPPAG
ncbi:MAG: SDR family oxidoreductase [Hyphomicrobiaceae bacterium]